MYGLHQILGFDNCPAEAAAIQDFIPNYRINLINPHSMEDMSVFRTCLQQIFSIRKDWRSAAFVLFSAKNTYT